MEIATAAYALYKELNKFLIGCGMNLTYDREFEETKRWRLVYENRVIIEYRSSEYSDTPTHYTMRVSLFYQDRILRELRMEKRECDDYVETRFNMFPTATDESRIFRLNEKISDKMDELATKYMYWRA